LTKDQWEKQDLPALQKDHPAIELPYLQDGERIICGTQAMITYLLHKYNRTELLGVSPEDKVKTATAAAMYW
jgi:glutathione S-transferase